MEFARLVEEGVTGPLRQAAARAPLDQRPLLLMLADNVDVNQSLGVMIRASVIRAAARDGGFDPAALAEISQFHSSMDRTLSVLKEVRRCTGPRRRPSGPAAGPQSPARPGLPPPWPGSV